MDEMKKIAPAAGSAEEVARRRRFLTGAVAAALGAAAVTAPESASARADNRGPWLSAKDFGAEGDGKTDDTAALRKAIAAVPAAGGRLFFPAGSYRITGELTLTHPIDVEGAGEESTWIEVDMPAGDVIRVAAGGVHLRSLGFRAKVKRVGGAYVNFTPQGNQSSLEHFEMHGPFVGVNMASGATLYVEKGSIREIEPGPGTAGITVTGGNDHYIRCVTMDNVETAQPAAGIWIQDSGCVNITDCDIIHCTKALYVTGGASIYAINTFFDTSVNGIYIAPSPTGIMLRSHFIGCWTSSHTDRGVVIANRRVDSVDFIGHHCFFNAKDGMVFADGKNVKVQGCSVVENGGVGVRVGAAARNVIVTGSKIGSTSVSKGNTHGVSIEPGADYVLICNNDLSGNTQSAVQGSAPHQEVSANLT